MGSSLVPPVDAAKVYFQGPMIGNDPPIMDTLADTPFLLRRFSNSISCPPVHVFSGDSGKELEFKQTFKGLR